MLPLLLCISLTRPLGCHFLLEACSEYPHPVGGKELLLISLDTSPIQDHSPGLLFPVTTWIGIQECSVTVAVSPRCWGTEARMPRTPLAVDALESSSKGWDLTIKLWSLQGLGLEQGETITFGW